MEKGKLSTLNKENWNIFRILEFHYKSNVNLTLMALVISKDYRSPKNNYF